jgi:hypothetical protein
MVGETTKESPIPDEVMQAGQEAFEDLVHYETLGYGYMEGETGLNERAYVETQGKKKFSELGPETRDRIRREMSEQQEARRVQMERVTAFSNGSRSHIDCDAALGWTTNLLLNQLDAITSTERMKEPPKWIKKIGGNQTLPKEEILKTQRTEAERIQDALLYVAFESKKATS